MTKARLLVFLAPFALLAPACSSVDAGPGNTSACPLPTNETGGDPFAAPDAGATAKYGTRDEVCATYACGLTAVASQLHCALDPTPKCPDVLQTFEKNAFPGKCVDAYDLGTIENCLARLSTYKLCSDFNDKKCEIRVRLLPDDKCASADAGTDSAPVDTGTDTGTGKDTGTDAGSDTKTDAPSDGSGGG
jgi:hypothetical protein